MLSERKTIPKASHLGVNIIYTLHIPDKALCFLFDFHIFPQPLCVFCIYDFLHIRSYIKYFVF